MAARYAGKRVRLYVAQGGRCDCCTREMWEHRVEKWEVFAARVSPTIPHAPPEQNASKKKHTRYLRRLRAAWRCTYEHYTPSVLRPGPDAERDVATCGDCNHRRGTLDYLAFRETVRERGSAKAAAASLASRRPPTPQPAAA